MAGSRATPAREPGQVRKEAALSDNRWALRDRPAGAFIAGSPRRPVSTEGARSIFDRLTLVVDEAFLDRKWTVENLLAQILAGLPVDQQRA
jgi:hypothetical protein